MKLYFATEARFIKRGNTYYSLGGFSKLLWQRYLRYFNELIVLARVSSDSTISVSKEMEASCENVRFIDLPYYVGLTGFLANYKKIHNIISNEIRNDGCYLCRLPGQIGGCLIEVLNKRHIPYSCEIVGNPWDVFSKDSITHPLRQIIRVISTIKLKRQVYKAQACLYVTKSTLQKQYPHNEKAYSVGVSDVIIEKETIAQAPKVLKPTGVYSLISVGSLAQMYKSPDILLKALSILKNRGIETHLTWLGDGIFKNDMVKLAHSLGLNVDFKGNVSSPEVHNCLEESNIFILASRTEGLPRALIEAMAHGLPCIGSKVGGIPELLDDSVLVEKGNALQLADTIERMITDVNFANTQAARNLAEAQSFSEEKLEQLRSSFFNEIMHQNEQQINTNPKN